MKHASCILGLMIATSAANAECEPVTKDELTISFEVDALVIRTGEEAKEFKKLSLDGPSATCESLKLVDGADAVSVTYQERGEGTSTVVSDKQFGVMSLKTGQWLVLPFVVERKITTGTEAPEVTKLTEVSFTKKKSRVVLIKKDVASKKKEEIPL